MTLICFAKWKFMAREYYIILKYYKPQNIFRNIYYRVKGSKKYIYYPSNRWLFINFFGNSTGRNSIILLEDFISSSRYINSTPIIKFNALLCLYFKIYSPFSLMHRFISFCIFERIPALISSSSEWQRLSWIISIRIARAVSFIITR